MILKENRILFFPRETTDGTPLEEIDLYPSNSEVTVHSGVTAAELTNTTATDLPYIMRWVLFYIDNTLNTINIFSKFPHIS